MNVEQSLQALAAADAAAQVPPHVDAAVMAAWDASCRERDGRERRLRHRRVAMAWAIGCVLAAILVAIAVGVRPQSGDQARRGRRDSTPVESAAPVVPDAIVGTFASPRGIERPRLPSLPRRPSRVPPPVDAAYVLVPDAGAGALPLTMMRVRMPRSAFSRLGLPIANPDGDGMVDVEMLVGEDGVARSIRRAAAVGWVDANRE